MDKAPRQPSKIQPFFQSYLGRAVIGVILLGVIQSVFILMVVLPYQHERQVAKAVEGLGGKVFWRSLGPDWIPQSLQGTVPVLFARIVSLSLPETVDYLPSGLIPEIASLQSLEQLNLNGTRVDDSHLRQIKKLRNLRELGLGGTQVTNAGMEHLQNLLGLRKLRLDGTQVTDAGIKSLVRLTNIECLILYNTPISDGCLKYLKGMTHLKSLDLRYPLITDAGLEQLKEMSSLQYLILNEPRTTEEGRSMLRKAIPNCTITPEP